MGAKIQVCRPHRQRLSASLCDFQGFWYLAGVVAQMLLYICTGKHGLQPEAGEWVE